VAVVGPIHPVRGRAHPRVLAGDHPVDRSSGEEAGGPFMSVRWTDVAGAMVLRLSGRVAELADAVAVGVKAVVVDSPVILDVRQAEATAAADVAVVLHVAAGAAVRPGRVCVVASTPGTQFGLAVFRTVADALQAWCFAENGYGSGWR
jgi:hypothetical protein